YQITDQPELISAGQHWIVRDSNVEAERVEVCEGCPRCSAANLPGTRFFLPWAEDPNSRLRKALSAEVVTTQDRSRLRREFEQSLTPAMLFLRNVRFVSIAKNGTVSKKLTRTLADDKLVIDDGETAEEWILLEGNFDDEATSLREKYGLRIEEKR